MASADEAVMPADIPVGRAEEMNQPGHLASTGQSGKTQTRALPTRGFTWRQRYATLKARTQTGRKLLAFVRARKNDGKPFWMPHPLADGLIGSLEENLVRSAAMDTDTSGDGVVDDFASVTSGTGFTFTLNGTEGAQEITADGTGSNGDSARVQQIILRVYGGDEVVASFDAKLANTPSDIEGQVRIRFRDRSGNTVGSLQVTSFTATSYGRRVVVATAPDDAAFAEIHGRMLLTAAGGSGDVRFRDARFIRASSDPAWANPHVDASGSTTGDTIDLAGLPASTDGLLVPGDLIRFGGSGSTQSNAESDEVVPAFEVQNVVDSDGSGLASVEIKPQAFAADALGGKVVRANGVRLRSRVLPQTQMPRTAGIDLIRDFTVHLQEFI